MKETKSNKKMKEEVKNYKEKYEKVLKKYEELVGSNEILDLIETENYEEKYEELLERYIEEFELYDEYTFYKQCDEIDNLKKTLNIYKEYIDVKDKMYYDLVKKIEELDNSFLKDRLLAGTSIITDKMKLQDENTKLQEEITKLKNQLNEKNINARTH